MASKRQRRDKVTASAGRDAIHGVLSSSPPPPPRYLTISLICLFLVLSSGAVYWQVKDHQFISFDDNIYVTSNTHVIAGLNPENIKWAFRLSNRERVYWHPLTWISHMLDVQMWGMDAGKHHLSNLFLHIANTLLVFFVLRGMTGALWKSAFAASLFALHPLNVDTVAWIAERKNLLSTFFWLLVMLAYLFYTKRRVLSRYMLVVLGFVLGLLAKPMLVTLPFVLLLLDYWPLGRIKLSRVDSGWSLESDNLVVSDPWGSLKSRVILDKIPLILLSLVSIYISIISLQSAGSSPSFENIPMGLRVENAVVSYSAYLWKAIWPHDLAIYYPFPKMIPLWQAAGSFLVIAIISALVGAARKYPYLLVGWLWYIGTLFPVIGLVQGGLWPAMADRWAYVPLIGVYIMVSWGVSELAGRWRFKGIALAAVAGIVLSVLSVTSWIQAGYWKDSETLFRHTLTVTKSNFVAHNNLGKALFGRGDVRGAIEQYRQALHINPNSENAHYNMGRALAEEGHYEEAIEHYRECIKIYPQSRSSYNDLGNIMAVTGNFDEAVKYYRESLRIDPHQAWVYYNLGKAYLKKGKNNEAIGSFQEAIREKPGYAEAIRGLEEAAKKRQGFEDAILKMQEMIKARPEDASLLTRLGDIYYQQDEYDKAIAQYEKALSIQPQLIPVIYKLVFVYSNRQEYVKVLDLLENLRRMQPDNPGIYYNIACIYARQGKVDESVKWLKEAVDKGFADWGLLKKDRDLESIRGTAYYEDLMKLHGNG